MKTFDANRSDPMMTRKEVAGFLHVSARTVSRLADRDTLTAYQVNCRIVRYDPIQVASLLKAGTPKTK